MCYCTPPGESMSQEILKFFFFLEFHIFGPSGRSQLIGPPCCFKSMFLFLEKMTVKLTTSPSARPPSPDIIKARL